MTTPQIEAMHNLLMISVTKWSDAMHRRLAAKREQFPDRAAEFDEQSRKVEEAVDKIIGSNVHKTQQEVMAIVDDLHKQIVSAA